MPAVAHLLLVAAPVLYALMPSALMPPNALPIAITICVRPLSHVSAQDMERHDDAEALLRRVVASKEGALGPHHTSLASSLANLGLLLQRRGRWVLSGRVGRGGWAPWTHWAWGGDG